LISTSVAALTLSAAQQLTKKTMKTRMLLMGVAVALGVAGAAQAQDMGTTKSGGKVAMCIGCHGIPGYKVAYPQLYHVPMIAGQSGKYIENALKAYRGGERRHPTMAAIAATLTDKDIEELAKYYSTLGGGAK
jgi:cytochrome c553